METILSPLDFFRRARKLHPQREAVVDGALRLTYTQFGDRCDRWSSALAKLGVKPGDRVGTIAPNTHEHLEQYYAVPQLGAVLVPMNYRLTADDFIYLASHSGCKVLCVHPDYFGLVDSVRSQMKTVEHFVGIGGKKEGWLDYEALLAAASPDFPKHELAETDLLTINYTSGTTSRPKGVMITHRNAWTNSVGVLVHWNMVPSDRYLWTLPMFHANGWTFTWTITAVGATHVCLPKVEAALIYEAINKEQVTHLCAAPTVLIAIANGPEEKRKAVRRGVKVFTAGAPPAAATIERMEGELGWDITQVYGLTETAPFISICEPLSAHAELSAGERAKIKSRQGVELITSGELDVVDEEMKPVPHDGATLGEIVARGNVVMKGYYNDPEATAKAFAGGWFHSGDAAIVYPDGYIEIRDRFKDVIISGGENISSIEVEGALLRHPAVLEVAVVGMPHEKWGESPNAFIVAHAGKTATPEELKAFCRENLAHFKVPTAFHFVNELPKTATGKIQKFVLRGSRAGITAQ
ncbi:fatty-acyl-CoA synthase [Panacagrimonas perspica]|uniref:Fatty-acyl-CoA synthase n=1 Tax=Panacagrimonas perspica TaxID=381431 RepID=A0A4V3US42_9GAMM|nr:long-chain-fatty-acid--CoA ligase [Panacagrimonas perspica]TDU32344.1 fatty-acyl-CoA synthase [Panacagrimonas perspica]THD05281.1 o-succinylbenzoate--CoA ligase [Panacagrimonas perspica]